MSSLGLFGMDALKIMSEVWNGLAFENIQDHTDATHLVWETLERVCKQLN